MKMSITFDGFEKMATELNEKGQDVKVAVSEALEETQRYVQQEVESASAPYANGSGKKQIGLKYSWANGNMYDAIIRNPKIEWSGNVATVGVGFSPEQNKVGFMTSLFVMYGVPAHGKFNRGYQKDAKVYNAIKGVRTQKHIAELQKEIMEKHLKMGR